MNQTHKEIKSTKLTFTETPKAEIYPVKDPKENGHVDRGNPVKSPEVKVIAQIGITHANRRVMVRRRGRQSGEGTVCNPQPSPAAVWQSTRQRSSQRSAN